MSGILVMWITYAIGGAIMLGVAWVFRKVFQWQASRQRKQQESPDSREV